MSAEPPCNSSNAICSALPTGAVSGKNRQDERTYVNTLSGIFHSKEASSTVSETKPGGCKKEPKPRPEGELPDPVQTGGPHTARRHPSCRAKCHHPLILNPSGAGRDSKPAQERMAAPTATLHDPQLLEHKAGLQHQSALHGTYKATSTHPAQYNQYKFHTHLRSKRKAVQPESGSMLYLEKNHCQRSALF